jgi:hypothetical protein
MSKTVKVIMGSFRLGDVEDPEIYAAGPLMEWQDSEKGQWCLENSISDPYYSVTQDYNSWGYIVKITGELMEKDYTYFTLRWGSQ